MSLRPADRDPSVDPGTDIYRHANGGWLDATSIPPGYGAWGSFEEIHERNEATLIALLQAAAADPGDELDRKLGDAFAAGMDLAAIEAAGLTPIVPLLAAADTVASADDVMGVLAELHRDGVFGCFGWGVTVDHDDSTAHLLWLVPGGLGLPDRDSYDATTPAAIELREAYVAHVAAQLVNAGADPEAAAADAAGVLDLETRLASHQLRAEERRDPSRTLHRHSVAELAELALTLDLPGYLAAIGAGAATTVNVAHPPFFEALHDELAATNPVVLRAYLRFHIVRSMADALPRAIDDEAFTFYGRRVQGKKEQRERIKRVVAAVGEDMGELLGHRFVAEAFPPDAKERADAMVAGILEQMRASLLSRTWMGDATRAEALTKLEALRVKIGYPASWRDWSGLRIGRSTYAANRLAAARFELDRQLAQITEPVDTDEWEMPAHAVNAYYHPTRNEIVFPAGILQPPMFDASADDALNYGGIGTVIAHEVTHGFDDTGRRFDARGAFRDWWTADDQERYGELTERLVAQFDAYVAVDDVHVNGRLTLGENIADLGGLMLAQRAHAAAAEGQPDIDGLTPAQRFFLAAATIWRAHTSDELARTLAQIDPHSPRPLRVRGPFSNSTAFAEAFGLPDDAPALRAPEDRLEIW